MCVCVCVLSYMVCVFICLMVSIYVYSIVSFVFWLVRCIAYRTFYVLYGLIVPVCSYVCVFICLMVSSLCVIKITRFLLYIQHQALYQTPH